MKIDIDINYEDIRKAMIEKIAQACFDQILNGYDLDGDYDKRQNKIKEMRREILMKIDWKNAGSQLSETVVQKFFMNLLDKK